MTDALSEKFKELPEIGFPDGLHDRIINRAAHLRFRKVFVTILSVLLLNFAAAGLFFFIRLIDNDAFSFIGFMFREFEISGGYFAQFLSVLFENVPIGLLLTLLFNVILIGYVLKVYFSFKNAGRAFLSNT